MAYDAWCEAPGRMTYAVYRAAEDRADAAEVALSASARRRSPSPDRGHRGNQCATSCVVRADRADGPVNEALMSVDELRFLLDGVPTRGSW